MGQLPLQCFVVRTNRSEIHTPEKSTEN